MFSSRFILVAFLLLTGIAEGVIAHQDPICKRDLGDATKIERGAVPHVLQDIVVSIVSLLAIISRAKMAKMQDRTSNADTVEGVLTHQIPIRKRFYGRDTHRCRTLQPGVREPVPTTVSITSLLKKFKLMTRTHQRETNTFDGPGRKITCVLVIASRIPTCYVTFVRNHSLHVTMGTTANGHAQSSLLLYRQDDVSITSCHKQKSN